MLIIKTLSPKIPTLMAVNSYRVSKAVTNLRRICSPSVIGIITNLKHRHLCQNEFKKNVEDSAIIDSAINNDNAY